jgi:uroporphyrinogen III methyltransferase / synthase
VKTDARGIVFLVGAGPGDPQLLTLRGKSLLETADVVAFDALLDPAMLDLAPSAEKVFVGKRAGDHSMSQDQINALLIEHARAGRRVVRLKGGDPLIFGRGGEEAEALQQAAIPFEIVPGVTTAVAAAAYCGVPLTHRESASTVAIAAGYDPDALDFSSLARFDTAVFYMATRTHKQIAAGLIGAGRPASTPMLIVSDATLVSQSSHAGTLESFASDSREFATPALLIVGPTVDLRKHLDWFERRPFFGQTVLVTRSRVQASDLSQRLRELGASVIEAPTIDIQPPSSFETFDAVVRSLADTPGTVVFTSVNGVSYTADRLRQNRLDSRVFARCRLASVGAATAAAMWQKLGLRADVVSRFGTTDSLIDDFAGMNLAPARFILLRSDIARPTLKEWLVAHQHEVVDVPVYETRRATSLPSYIVDKLRERKIDWITFTSSSTARFLAELLGEDHHRLMAGVKLASIGPITSTEIRSLGLSPVAEASPPGIAEIVDAMLRVAKSS